MNIYQNIVSAKKEGKKLLAVLIEPEKMDLKHIPCFFEKIHNSIATHIFIGGSTDKDHQTESVVMAVKKRNESPSNFVPRRCFSNY